MNRLFFERESAYIGQGAFARAVASRALHSLQLWPHVKFDGGDAAPPPVEGERTIGKESAWACQAGVNSLAVDRMLTGGADSTIKLWDLEHITPKKSDQILKPIGDVKRSPSTHQFGITHVSFYPFEPTAFLSSSYDHTLKIYSTDTLQPSASFTLDSIIYTHSLSPIASHLLVACCTQHPLVRLVDLHSGASTQSLAGHNGAVLAASWSPTNEHILATGGTDGTLRIWDVRKASGTLRLLDLEDSIGLSDGLDRPSRAAAKAHGAAVNGIEWTDDGQYIVSAGHDAAVRVWDASSGANTLAHFGPTLRNSKLETKPLLVSPVEHTKPRGGLLVYPNEGEVVVFELHEGRVVSRLRLPGPSVAVVRARTGTGERSVGRRVTSLAWRGAGEGFVSAGSDGVVRLWGPGAGEDMVDEVVDGDRDRREEGGREKRKREVLDDVFKDLTRTKITFG
ncbi:hypothetical protein V494_00658 [Pseudogymnoascus sp. VKM F-4513 (FW-928)]|nr:hypothetical protein V494_00658 [Pseudogymnoascus sp. VKM F-4513 (FW-928)]